MIINSHFYKSTIVLTMFAIIMITQGCEKISPDLLLLSHIVSQMWIIMGELGNKFT